MIPPPTIRMEMLAHPPTMPERTPSKDRSPGETFERKPSLLAPYSNFFQWFRSETPRKECWATLPQKEPSPDISVERWKWTENQWVQSFDKIVKPLNFGLRFSLVGKRV